MTAVIPVASRWYRARSDGLRLAVLFCSVLGLTARQTLFLRKRTQAQYDDIDTAAAAQILIVIVALLALLANSANLVTVWRRIRGKAAGIAIIYFVFGAVSAFLSVNVAYSLFRAVECLVMACAIAVILQGARSLRQAEVMALSLAWGALLFDVIGRAKLGGFRLGSFASNSVSASAAMLACYCFGEWLAARGSRRMYLLIGLGVALCLVILSLSLASWWACMGGMMLAGFVLNPGIAGVLMLLVLLLAAIALGPAMLDQVVLRDRPMRELSTLHGRLFLWQSYWEAFQQHPILGYGYAVGARLKSAFYTTHTHNSVLSALLGGGIVGAGVFLLAWAAFVLDVVRTRLRRVIGWSGCAAAILCGLANSLAFAFIGEGWMPSTVVFFSFLMLHALHVSR